MQALSPVLKACFVFLIICYLFLSLLFFVFKDFYNNISKIQDLYAYQNTALWAIHIFTLFCSTLFVVATFLSVGQKKHEHFSGFLLAYAITIIDSIYFYSVYHKAFVAKTMLELF